jgi:hypothetical protein
LKRTYGTEGRWAVGSGWQELGPVPPDGGIMDNVDPGVFGVSGDGDTVTGLYWRPGQQGRLGPRQRLDARHRHGLHADGRPRAASTARAATAPCSSAGRKTRRRGAHGTDGARIR